MLFDQREQDGSVLWMQSDAAVRCRTAEMSDLVTAVNGVTAIEENRIRHRRPIVFARKTFPRQPLGAIASIRRAVSPARRRNRPLIAQRTADCGRYPLRRLVNGDYDTGFGGRATDAQCGNGSDYNGSD